MLLWQLVVEAAVDWENLPDEGLLVLRGGTETAVAPAEAGGYYTDEVLEGGSGEEQCLAGP
jgi:hypothetical protein